MANDPPVCTTIAQIATDRMPERRKRQRLAAQWPLRISKVSNEAIDVRTVNVSSDGFYCRASECFSPGEILSARLEIPASADRAPGPIVLCCEIRVLRIDNLTDSSAWGIAFRLLNYSVLRTGGAEIDGGEDQEISIFGNLPC